MPCEKRARSRAATTAHAQNRRPPITGAPSPQREAIVGHGYEPRAAATRAADAMWAVVLAGAHERPAAGAGAHRRPRSSRVRRLLDRVSVLVADERTLVVGLRRHRRALCTGLAPHSPGLLLQPRDRGSAPAILLAAQCIARLDSTATVATFPADHDVAEDRQFMIHVADAAEYVALYPERVVLLAVEATEADTQYGWISPGWPLARIGATTISGVGCFVEEPSPADAQAYLEAGALWNTFVMVARAATLADIGRQHIPAVHERLAAAVPFLGTDWEPAVLRSTYAALPPASFSCAILERAAPRLAVSRLAGVTWSARAATRAQGAPASAPATRRRPRNRAA